MSKPAPSPAEQCAACGHGAHGNHVCPGCLMGCGSSLPPPVPSPATPCQVYPCPCACHRLGPHVPTDECDEAASDVRLHRRPCKCEHRWDEHAGAEPRFCLVPDCECQCFIPAHTQRADERTILEEEFDALADEIVALRDALKKAEEERGCPHCKCSCVACGPCGEEEAKP